MTAAVRAGLIESSVSRSARLLRIPTVVRRGGRIRFGGAKQSRLRRRRAGRTLTVSGGTRPTPPVVANLAHHSAVGLFVVVTAGPEYLLFLCDVYAPRLAADRAAAPLSLILRSLAPNRKRRASRQTSQSQSSSMVRPSGGIADGPALPRLRESSRCLLAARSAAACKRTSLSLPWPSSHRALTAGCCRDEWPWRLRRPSAPAFTDDQAKARVRVSTASRPRRSGAVEGVGAGRRPAPVQIGDSGRRGPFCGL